MKKNFIDKCATLFVALTLLLTLTTPLSQAAQPCTVSFSDPTVTVGNNVTINVSVHGKVAAATIRMAFDSNYLQFVSVSGGMSRYESGAVLLYNESYPGSNMSFSMTFKALKTGKTTVTCAYKDIVDDNAEQMSVNMGNSVVTINAPQTASGNNNLSSLSISPGTLSPNFSAGTTNYKAWVSNGTTSVAVSAQTQDGKAKMVYWGNSGFKVGDNTVTVQVTAENGAKKYYTITVNRAAATGGGNTTPQDTPAPSPTATPEPQVMVTLPDDTQLPIAAQLPEEVSIPKGFEQSQVEVEGKSFPAIVHKEGNFTAVYLTGDEKHPAGFYSFNTKTQEAWQMAQVAMASGKLVLVDLPQDMEIPEGYSSTLMELGGQQHTLLVPDGVEQPNHYIVYALDGEGKLGLYLYDVEQKTFQRYQFLQLPQQETEETQEPEQNGFVFSILGWRVETSWSDQTVSYLLVGLSLLGVLLLAAVVVLAVFLARSRRALRQEWMHQEQQRQQQIISGPSGADMTLDDILAEYKEPQQDQENEDE